MPGVGFGPGGGARSLLDPSSPFSSEYSFHRPEPDGPFAFLSENEPGPNSGRRWKAYRKQLAPSKTGSDPCGSVGKSCHLKKSSRQGEFLFLLACLKIDVPATNAD
jgi:hypothetical protein